MKTVYETFFGSDGQATVELYNRLRLLGNAGIVAMNLCRACKNSSRAKQYRGGIRGQGSYKHLAYGRKQYAMSELCIILEHLDPSAGLVWGWKADPEQEIYRWVLYVDIPTGQVSFHTVTRGTGPDYPSEWDGQHKSAERIIAWVEMLLQKQGWDKEMVVINERVDAIYAKHDHTAKQLPLTAPTDIIDQAQAYLKRNGLA